MMNDETGSRGGPRTNSTSNYYPTVDELLGALSNDAEYKALTGKLNKEWLHCLLKDTLLHLKQAKSHSITFDTIDKRMKTFDGMIEQQCYNNNLIEGKLQAFDELLQQQKLATAAVQKSLDDMKLAPGHLNAANNPDDLFKRQLKIVNIDENDKPSFNERALADKSALEKISADLGVHVKIDDCRRIGKYDTSRKRPIIVTFNSVWDARLLRSKAIESKLYNSSGILIVPELSPADKEKERKLLKKRYDLVQCGYDKTKLRIRNLRLFHNDAEIPLD